MQLDEQANGKWAGGFVAGLLRGGPTVPRRADAASVTSRCARGDRLGRRERVVLRAVRMLIDAGAACSPKRRATASSALRVVIARSGRRLVPRHRVARMRGHATAEPTPGVALADDDHERRDGDLLQALGFGRTDRLQPWLAAFG
jgi:hypothetical protein